MDKQELETILKKDFPIEGNILEIETQLNNRMGYLFGLINNEDNNVIKDMPGFTEVFHLNYGMYASTAGNNNFYINAIDKMYKSGVLPMIGGNYK